MSRTKSITRAYVYGLNVDEDIKEMAERCNYCAQPSELPIKDQPQP